MLTISRRGFLVLGGSGAAGAALAACGAEEDPRADGRDGELLAVALAAEQGLTAAYQAALADLATAEQGVVNVCRNASASRGVELERLAEDADAGPGTETAVQTTGVEGAVAAGNLAIAAYRTAAGLLPTPELRRIVTAYLAAVAAEQASLRALGGDEPLAPEPFVTGSAERPLVASDGDSADAGEPATSTTSTTTGEGG